MIWEKFITDPTFTVETTHYPTESIPFPAVAICDTKMVYGPSTKNITKLLQLRGFETGHINEFYRSLTEIKQKGYVVKSNIKKIHNILENLGYTYNNLIYMLKKPCEKLIEECLWRSKSYDCSQIFRSVFTFLGYCCQFDLSYFRSLAGENINYAAGTDLTEALDIVLNTEKFDNNGINTLGSILMFIFDEQNNITLIDSAITVTTATYFDVTIDISVMDSSTDVKALSLHNRRCFLKTDTDFKANSFRSCMMKRVMKKIVELCQCLPFNIKSKELNVEEFPSCKWSHLTCIFENLENMKGNFHEVVSGDKCYQDCDYVQYETQVEYLKQERAFSENRMLSSRVTLHFKDNSCMKYRREVLYTWDQMLANLGGIFGLCLGGSIISIVEIIWFFTDILYTCFANFRKGKVSPKSREVENRIFVLSRKNYAANKTAKKDHISGKFKFVH
ncbi:unnamed protein product [Parnassius mnemosyne]|uniref:Uncharacterized protein n=1 Tax=Parnassius mnemosyne TaxID=213953 RepID=A0AAV1MAA3_9NEOP